ncbi:MAG: 50S ribosomal protein L18 [Candidatus Doudnabacteria bacterium]|nr:50S ribosomal protein L18 [bacterium]MDZ4243994.1 50S ribosomal protein L18 [Candidatus Doudnabacteria bacterium]
MTRQENRINRHRRIRAKISGTASRPRLSLFKSHKHIHLQLIDDEKSVTVASASTEKSKGKDRVVDAAKLLAKSAAKAGIKEAVFDRGGNIYHGRVEAVGKALREAGLKI